MEIWRANILQSLLLIKEYYSPQASCNLIFLSASLKVIQTHHTFFQKQGLNDGEVLVEIPLILLLDHCHGVAEILLKKKLISASYIKSLTYLVFYQGNYPS